MDTSIFGALFEILAPIALIVLIGYWLARSTEKIDTVQISSLVMLVGTPALVFSTLTTTELPSAVLLQVSFGALCASFCASVYAVISLKFLGYSVRTFLPAMTMPNSGNLGLPLVLLTFGEEGLAFGIAFYFVIAVLQYTVMPIIVAGEISISTIVREPIIWSVVAALFVVFGNFQVPGVIADTTRILGGMMIPVMLIILGAAIERLGFGDLRVALKLAVLRLVIGLVAGASAILLLRTSGIASGTIFLMTAMPSALVTYVVAARYGRNSEKVAGLVVTSTLLSLGCAPLILWAAIHIAGV
jgi:predicted permease